ncbi:lipase 3-like [Pieris napi]|uniref:lipase 3-like n=1 Tax=Pieris napi TaxID=78633 RepID=UPI001FBAF5F5|nr:lipase 3-like [Pieris napi]
MVRLRGINLVLFLILIMQIRYSISKKTSIRDIIEDFHDTLPKNNNKSNKNIIEQKLRNDGKINDDIYLNITQLITKYKYSVEVYEVITSDGYVIKLFRIPGNGAIVFLMHGIISSADDWISGGVESGLAYLLAQLGYDVWMGNARGNKHSRSNIYIDPSEKKFWDFSFHEIGMIDVPTMIDFVLEKTNKSSLIYIGHSQGTTAFFIMCSLRPEYNKKITLMISLSPIAWLSHMKNPILNILKPFYGEIVFLASALGVVEVVQDSRVLRGLQRTFCGDEVWAFTICQHIIFIIGGFNYNQTNYEQLPVIYNHFPSGSSLKQLQHYGQLVLSGHFRQFDYKVKNIEKYGSLTPPSYPVEKITAPVAIFYGEGDWLSDVSDAQILKSRLPNLVEFYRVEDDHFSHFDFIYAADTKNLLLANILRLIKKIH